jgi:phosphatidylglycerophosphatase A
MRQLGLLIATAGGSGYFPIAPGTVGSAVGLLMCLTMRLAGGGRLEWLAVLVLFAVGSWAALMAERHFGRDDPGPVVIDEVMGQLVTTLFLPLSLMGLLVSFVVFRAFDIAKPWPARRLEDVPHGIGVMADDAMAGLYGNVAMRGLAWAMPGLLGGLSWPLW